MAAGRTSVVGMFFDFRPDRAFRLPVIKMPVILAGLADAPGPTHAATPMSNNVKVGHHELLPECVCAYAPADLDPGRFGWSRAACRFFSVAEVRGDTSTLLRKLRITATAR